MKKILLCTDGSAYARVAYEYAAWLARQAEARVEVLYVTDIRGQEAVQTTDFSGSIGIGAYQQLLSELVEVESTRARIDRQRAKIILESAEKFFSDRQISNLKLTHETGFLVDLFRKFEQDNDLIILGKRGENAGFAAEHLGSNLERIVRSSHKPCFVTPRTFKPVRRVLLAYDGGESCQRAIAYLSASPIYRNLELYIITVDTGNINKAARHLKSAQEIMSEACYTPISEILVGDPETEIEKYIVRKNIDLLVMGAYGHSRIRNLIIGSTTTQVLRNLHIPILLFR